MIDSEAYSHREKMMKLREELLSVEESRMSGTTGCSLDELDSYLNNIIDETVMLLCQQKPDDYIDVELDLDELDATSAETKATYQEIKEYVLKHSGLNVSNLYISQVKRKLGLEVGESYNKPKSQDTRIPVCPPNKESAIIDALKHFNMI